MPRYQKVAMFKYCSTIFSVFKFFFYNLQHFVIHFVYTYILLLHKATSFEDWIFLFCVLVLISSDMYILFLWWAVAQLFQVKEIPDSSQTCPILICMFWSCNLVVVVDSYVDLLSAQLYGVHTSKLIRQIVYLSCVSLSRDAAHNMFRDDFNVRFQIANFKSSF